MISEISIIVIVFINIFHIIRSFEPRVTVGSTHSQGGKSWQAFGERKKIPSILSSSVYLLIYNKNVVSVRITRIATKNVVFAHNCKYMGT